MKVNTLDLILIRGYCCNEFLKKFKIHVAFRPRQLLPRAHVAMGIPIILFLYPYFRRHISSPIC